PRNPGCSAPRRTALDDSAPDGWHETGLSVHATLCPTPPRALRTHQFTHQSASITETTRSETAWLSQADARTRTGDPFITSEVLYQLSYVGGRRSVLGALVAPEASRRRCGRRRARRGR